MLAKRRKIRVQLLNSYAHDLRLLVSVIEESTLFSHRTEPEKRGYKITRATNAMADKIK